MISKPTLSRSQTLSLAALGIVVAAGALLIARPSAAADAREARNAREAREAREAGRSTGVRQGFCSPPSPGVMYVASSGRLSRRAAGVAKHRSGR